MADLTIEQVMDLAPVIPVLTIERLEHAVPLAQALVAGGLRALEITLRTDTALAAIAAIAKAVPDAVPGVGTVTTPQDLASARAAGARFAVSPGFAADLAADLTGAAGALPFLPGVATASEAMAAQRAGLRHLKFFPAEAMGGRATLQAFGGPFANLVFCPTGGIGRDNAGDYLNLKNVRCVGGSWVAPREAVMGEQWDGISALAAEASSLVRH
jgi:2-dehydro-3-deoxyphosphogluconate aldolase / (4S)-4-hydroxy-2-oxoglutarate aldolase